MFILAMIVLVFLSRMIWGTYSTIQLIKQMRAKRNYKGAILNIAEKIIPERIIEPSTWIVTITLDVGRALLGFLILFLLFIKSKDNSLLFYPNDLATLLLVIFLCVYAVWVSGYLFGSLLARAPQDSIVKVRHEAISEQGILYTGKIIVWDHFRGYVVSSDGRYIYLMSKYYPAAIGYSFAPASPEEFNLIIGEIKRHLPNCDFTSDSQVGIFENVYFQSVFLSVILLLIGLTGLMLPAEFGILLNSLLMYLHLTLSVKIVDRIIPTDKFLVAETE